MKPIVHIHEQDGMRVAVATQVVIVKGRHGGARGKQPLTQDEREARADARAEAFEFAALCVRFGVCQVVYLVGVLFACSFWLLGRAGDVLRSLEAGMGGSPKQLVPGMLPPWMRTGEQHKQLPAETRTFDSGHRLLTKGDDDR